MQGDSEASGVSHQVSTRCSTADHQQSLDDTQRGDSELTCLKSSHSHQRSQLHWRYITNPSRIKAARTIVKATPTYSLNKTTLEATSFWQTLILSYLPHAISTLKSPSQTNVSSFTSRSWSICRFCSPLRGYLTR